MPLNNSRGPGFAFIATPPPGSRGHAGFTVIELLVVLALIGLLTSMVGPSLARMRSVSGFQTGRAQVTAALASARATSARSGRTSMVVIDTATGMLRVQVDTSDIGRPASPVVVRDFHVERETGTSLGSNRDALCFDARGIGVIATGCSETGARITLRIGDTVDTIRVNAAGRAW